MIYIIIFATIFTLIFTWVYLEEKSLQSYKDNSISFINDTKTSLDKEPYLKEIQNSKSTVQINNILKIFEREVYDNNVTEHILDKYSETLSSDDLDKILNGVYFIGMTEEMAIDSQRRQPDKVEFEVLKTKTKKVFVYGNKSSGDVLTFENGILTRFKDR